MHCYILSFNPFLSTACGISRICMIIFEKRQLFVCRFPEECCVNTVQYVSTNRKTELPKANCREDKSRDYSSICHSYNFGDTGAASFSSGFRCLHSTYRTHNGFPAVFSSTGFRCLKIQQFLQLYSPNVSPAVRGRRLGFFRAFALASAKQKRARIKAKALFFLPPTLESGFQSPKMLGRG
jgi:hypothetical protein